jgi:parallel beta-helix repeat protein
VILDGAAFFGSGEWAGWETSFALTRDGVTLRGLRIQGFRIGLWVMANGNAIEGNVIAGNVDADLYLQGASGNRIVGNYVSIDPSGTPIGQGFPGFDIGLGSAMNLIEGNLFGGSVFVADPGSYNNSFIGNRIGVDVNGRPAPVPCGAAPFCLLALDEPFNRAGGPLSGEGNIVAWRIVARAGNLVLGNEVVSGP